MVTNTTEAEEDVNERKRRADGGLEESEKNMVYDVKHDRRRRA